MRWRKEFPHVADDDGPDPRAKPEPESESEPDAKPDAFWINDLQG